MKYIQVRLKHDNVEQVCWIPSEGIKRGMRLSLKNDDTIWTVDTVWPITLDKEDINRGWHVGGL